MVWIDTSERTKMATIFQRGVHWTQCNHYVIFRIFDHYGLKLVILTLFRPIFAETEYSVNSQLQFFCFVKIFNLCLQMRAVTFFCGSWFWEYRWRDWSRKARTIQWAQRWRIHTALALILTHWLLLVGESELHFIDA